MLRTLSVLFFSVLLVACGGSDATGKAALQAVENGALLIDVRTAEEFAGGHLPGAINIPHGEIVEGVAALQADPTAPIVVYCRTGNRSGIAEGSLRDAGYGNVMNAGGYAALQPIWDSRG